MAGLRNGLEVDLIRVGVVSGKKYISIERLEANPIVVSPLDREEGSLHVFGAEVFGPTMRIKSYAMQEDKWGTLKRSGRRWREARILTDDNADIVLSEGQVRVISGPFALEPLGKVVHFLECRRSPIVPSSRFREFEVGEGDRAVKINDIGVNRLTPLSDRLNGLSPEDVRRYSGYLDNTGGK